MRAEYQCGHEYIKCLGTRLKVNIMSYDYCGYGQSSGKPNESNLNKACFACYEKMKERYNLRPEQIILYGQSIGTGMASKIDYHKALFRRIIYCTNSKYG